MVYKGIPAIRGSAHILMNPKSKLALCMIVKADNREAELLDRCLGGVFDKNKQLLPEHMEISLDGVDGIAKHVDAIYLTITGENPACEEVAKKYGAIVSHYKWDHNFANARNFNFSQVPEEYTHIVWCDADDLWWNPELLGKTAQRMSDDGLDYVYLNYFYHFDKDGYCDVQHVKTRMLVHDGSIKWAGALHEDFTTEREIAGVIATELGVYHFSDDKRLAASANRNSEIAAKAMSTAPNDAKSYWNLANSMAQEGLYAQVIPVYLEFLDRSGSDEERYLAWHRVAQCYYKIGDMDRAISCETEAISIRPWYPDAYFGMGEMFLYIGKYRHAREMMEMGLSKPKPETEIIVWNPRDYDFNPRMVLSEIYMRLHKPKDALKQLKLCSKIYPKNKRIKHLIKITKPEIVKFEYADKLFAEAKKAKTKEDIVALLDTVPAEMKYYPPIISLRNMHFTKTESSGRDVVIYCGYTSHEWNPEVFATKGVGGSEEAIVQLAKRWKEMGYDVTVYLNNGFKDEEYDGVHWRPFLAFNHRDKQDVVIVWRHPKPIDLNINADKIFVDVHDVISGDEFTPGRLAKITRVMFKSQAHRENYPNVPDDKAMIVKHGLDLVKFDERAAVVKRNPYKIVNTSSPDRGLLTSMDIIERVYNKLPEDLKYKLLFRWNYGFRVWDGDFKNDATMMAWKTKALEKMESLMEKGIMDPGSGDMLSQNDIVDQYLSSGLLLYPSEFFEIGFISGLKGALAGAIPVTTDVFAQGEFLKDGILVHSDANFSNWRREIERGVDYGVQSEEKKEEFADKIVEYMKNPEAYEEMRNNLIQDIRQNFDWDLTAKLWADLF